MNPERWTRVNELFLAAADLTPRERVAYLDAACDGDDLVRLEVEQLLAGDSPDDDHFLKPVTEVRDLGLPSESADDSLIGQRVGRYEIRNLLGEGGMGRVYLAVRVEDYSQQVVLKFLRREVVDAATLDRFRNEMQIQAELGSHPNIARLLDAGATDDGRPFLAMEYVDGQEIDQYCNDRGLAISERLQLFLDVSEAVQFAHQHAVIHRDLKPSNILVADSIVKLIDFGIAKLLGDDVGAFDQTRTAERALTPHYASPEHVQGQLLTTASDVYSLGVVLFELLTGRRPYRLTGCSAAEIERCVCEQQPTRPSSVAGNVGAPAPQEAATGDSGSTAVNAPGGPSWRRQLKGDLDNIVLKALRKEPQRRYQSARELASDIDRHLRGLPVRARPATWRYRSGKFVRRNKVVVIAATLAILSLVGGIVGTTTQWLKAKASAAAVGRINDELEANQLRQRRQLYVADMNLAQQAYESGSLARLTELLDRNDSPAADEDLRGFEWYYWRRMCQQEVAAHQVANTATCLAAHHRDGRELAAVGLADGDVELFYIGTQLPPRTLSGHTGRITCVEFSPDGEKLVTGGYDRVVNVWDVATGAVERTFDGHENWIAAAAFSRDGARIASATGRWNLPGEVFVWEVESGQVFGRQAAHADFLKCLSITADGRILATGGWDHEILLTPVDLSTPPSELGKHESAILALASSPDGRRLASASVDHTARIWDVAARELVHTLKGHAGSVNCVTYARDGSVVITGGADGAVKIWDPESGQLQATILAHADGVVGIAIDSSGNTITTAGVNGLVKKWDLTEVQQGAVLRGHDRAVYAIAFSPDGQTLVSGGYDGTLRFWDVQSRRPIDRIDGSFGRITGVAYSPDGERLFTAHRAARPCLKMWHAAERRPIEIPFAPETALGDRPGGASLGPITISRNGELLAAARWGARLIVWNTATWRPEMDLNQLRNAPGGVAFSPDGGHLAASDGDTICIWNAADASLAAQLDGHEGGVTALAFSADGKWLASGSQDRTIRLWDARSWQPVTTLRSHNGGVLTLAFAPDGKTLASGGADAAVKLWHLAAGELSATLKAHERAVTAVCFSPDGNLLASASEDNTIRFWRAVVR